MMADQEETPAGEDIEGAETEPEGAAERAEDGTPETPGAQAQANPRAVAINRTDLGNARRLVAYADGKIKYCPELKKWFLWYGHRWNADEDGKIIQCAKDVARRIQQDGANNLDDDTRQRLIKWGLQSESAARIKAMIELAGTEPGVPIAAAEFDSDPMLLGVANGTIDLRTGQLRAAERDNYITKRAPVEFDPDAVCPGWLKYLDDVTDGDQDYIGFLKRVAGYCLTGATNEQCMFILHGLGGNGKTVFIVRLETLLGNYAMVTSAETLMMKNSGGAATPDLARLKGARLVIASEPKEGAMLDEAVVKRATGQDTLICRYLYSNPFEYVPQFKFVLATNYKPTIKGDDYAIWRRIRLLPFAVTIPEDQRDKDLIEKPRTELSGILNWALEGLRECQKIGLAPPECVLNATRQYRADMDVIGDWISDGCIVRSDVQEHVKGLYASYRQWCKQSGHYAFSKRRFSQKMEARGLQRDHDRRGSYFVGVALRPADTGVTVIDVNTTVIGAMDTGEAD